MFGRATIRLGIGPHSSSVEFSIMIPFLANVNSRSGSLYAIARASVVCHLSVVCNVRAPYLGSSNFRQYFYGIRYRGHPLTSTEHFTFMLLSGCCFARPVRLGE